jgi:hypothetical protein
MHLMKATTKVAVVLLVLAGCTGEPVLSGGLGERQHGGLMFFRTFNSGDPTPELYRLPAPGAAPVRVTPVLRGGTSSSTSADGEWLAWLDEDVVWLRFLRNANERRVTPPGAVDGAPRLSHGGGRLILMRARQDQAGGAFPRITTVDVATLEESALDPDDGVGQTPALSPDGQLIVWRSSTRAMGLELLDAQGEWIRTLVPGAFTLRGTDSPVFSPNGLSVAFVARYFNTPNHSIVVINLYGDVLATWRTQHQVLQPAWSPNGERIAACLRPHDAGNSQDRIVVWDIATGTVDSLDNQGASDCYPSWGQ